MRKLIRKFFELLNKLLSVLRILKLKLIYPTLEVNFGSFISSGCVIICTDNSKMILENAYISNSVRLTADEGGFLKITNSYIGDHCVIVSSKSIIIDEYCEIAEMVVIRDQNHIFGKGNLRYSGSESASIKINKNVWVGSKASILKGVEIGDNAVIGASAVVNKNIPKNEVWAGIPASKIKSF